MDVCNENNCRFLLLHDGRQALDARVELIRGATHQIKLQTYIWKEDGAGRLIARELIRAADRGVQVQVLLDDFNTSNELHLFRALNAHPFINIHLFNPIPKVWRQGVFRWLHLIWEIRRMNRRMHNKALLVDNQLAIIGGRNIGDEYFDQDPKFNFLDLDLLCLGPVVAELSTSFDLYWHHEYAKPIKRWFRARRKRLYRRRLERLRREVCGYQPGRSLAELQAATVGAPVEVVCDTPSSFLSRAPVLQPKEVARRLQQLLTRVRETLTVESAYLVLSSEEIAQLDRLQQDGIAVKLLTNSLATNDVLANHGGFRNTRQALLAKGIAVHELAAAQGRPKIGLHGKALVIDHHTLFLGSYNLNERSALLNSELALILHHPGLARQVEEVIEELLAVSWQPELPPDGGMLWRRQGSEVVWQNEPEAGLLARMVSRLLSWWSMSRYF
ncbi:MAG: phospholipase D family protein [Desulfobulbaceae bacterium]|nr:phospholipase D family protein [Desulfobulbaceae bacterium]